MRRKKVINNWESEDLSSFLTLEINVVTPQVNTELGRTAFHFFDPYKSLQRILRLFSSHWLILTYVTLNLFNDVCHCP